MIVSTDVTDINDNNLEQMHLPELDQIPFNCIPHAIENCTNDVVSPTSNKGRWFCMKMSGYRMITSTDIFLLDFCQDSIAVNLNFKMAGTSVDITRKNSQCWTILWENNFVVSKIPNKRLALTLRWWSLIQKSKNTAYRKFEEVYPEAKHRQHLKKQLLEEITTSISNFTKTKIG